jgi:radical SAM-linked protein
MIIRVKYTKTGMLKYLSHLDMVRLMERAFRRAEIDLHYTQGFHPIAKMSFSPPVALGIESYGELLEADLNCASFDSEDFIDKLNVSLPVGCRILDAVKIDKNESKMSKHLLKADYKILFDHLTCDEIVISIQKALDSDSCIITKKNKSGKEVQTDIRNKIFFLDTYENGDKKAIMRCVLDSTQNSILSPISLINYLKENCYLQVDENYKITKTDMIMR